MGRKVEFCCFCLFLKEGLFALLAKSTEVLLARAALDGCPWVPRRQACPSAGTLVIGEVSGARERATSSSASFKEQSAPNNLPL